MVLSINLVAIMSSKVEQIKILPEISAADCVNLSGNAGRWRNAESKDLRKASNSGSKLTKHQKLSLATFKIFWPLKQSFIRDGTDCTIKCTGWSSWSKVFQNGRTTVGQTWLLNPIYEQLLCLWTILSGISTNHLVRCSIPLPIRPWWSMIDLYTIKRVKWTGLKLPISG